MMPEGRSRLRRGTSPAITRRLLACLLLALSPVGAGAQGTGSGGCYFDACDDEVRAERDRRFDEGAPPDNSSGASGQLVCNTLYGGSCVMLDQRYPEGQFCNCPGPFGSRVDGFTQRVSGRDSTSFQQPRLATQCTTLVGSCVLYNSVPVGTQCFCTSAFGPVGGVSQ